jgi:DNA-directed RNA polymerase III subunit RPC11
MQYFTVCPNCSNILKIAKVANLEGIQNRWECRTCPYIMPIKIPYVHHVEIKRKEVEDVMGGQAAWDNADKTDVQCVDTECDGSQAYFFQVQIRSADEPMTTFYRVC